MCILYRGAALTELCTVSQAVVWTLDLFCSQVPTRRPPLFSGLQRTAVAGVKMALL